MCGVVMVRVGMEQRRVAQPARLGRRKNRGEARAQGGFRPKVKEIKRKVFFLFLVSNFK
jgi:hypothetical protein